MYNSTIASMKGYKLDIVNSVPNDILKIQAKLCKYEVGSRNHKKYMKILKKHIKNHNMKKRVSSNIKTIENIQKLESEKD